MISTLGVTMCIYNIEPPQHIKSALTVNSLPISLLFPVEHGVLVLRQHLGLGRHGLLPHIEGLEGLALFLQRLIQRVYHGVDSPEASALPRLLELGESPWRLPV